MGYRTYFYRAKKDKTEEIRSLTCKKLVQYCKQNNIEVDDENEDIYIYLPDVLKSFSKMVFEFGKYYEVSADIEKSGERLFTHPDTNECFAEYYLSIVPKEAVLSTIEDYRKRIVSFYKSLLMDEDEYLDKINPCDDRTRYERMEQEIKSKLDGWNNKYVFPYSLDENKYPIVISWLYEYTIFELVRIYKETDWDNEYIIHYGG